MKSKPEVEYFGQNNTERATENFRQLDTAAEVLPHLIRMIAAAQLLKSTRAIDSRRG